MLIQTWLLVLAGLMTLSLATLNISNNGRALQGVRGRVALHARRHRRFVAGALVAALALALASGVPQLGTTAHRTLGLLSGLLSFLAASETWRSRRDERVLVMATLGGAVLALGALLSVFTPATIELHRWLTGGSWALQVLAASILLRRPVPSEAMQQLDREAVAKQPSLLNDYISLTKPKVISLLLVTTLAAMFITPAGNPGFWLVFWTMVGGYLAAGGAGAINCAFDGDIDNVMGRTSKRPVPSGRISPRHALIFGLLLNALSFAVLATFTTLLAAILAMVGTVYYAYFYTVVLKRSTPQNIVIGGGAGAIPPLVGWTAVTGRLDIAALFLFVIIFYWTPPHFWALALIKQKDYARAGVPMLPVVAGEVETRKQIWLYSLLMFVLSLVLTPLGAMGLVYLGSAVLLGGIFLYYAYLVWRTGEQGPIWGLYKYSLLYLALLFGAMVLDRMVLGS
jgi:heme o synthase